ncbi:MAG: hypothetical protein JF617_04670 [Burkholderiales bacterium]|nr:hypothetical protein [Burkholderiales bacterium]
MAVAVQLAAGVMVCSRAEPDVPQPLQPHEPPVVGCGPRMAELPAVTVADDVCVQEPLALM